MTKEEFIAYISEMSEDELHALWSGINQITFEYGWGANLGHSQLIQRLWELDY